MSSFFIRINDACLALFSYVETAGYGGDWDKKKESMNQICGFFCFDEGYWIRKKKSRV
jgi:hypothetical protein